MSSLLRHLRHFVLACTALALSAGLAFGATPPEAASGLANAAAHAGKTVPVVTDDSTAGDEDETAGEEDETAGDEDEVADESTDESDEVETDEVADTEDATDACTVDPTALTAEELDAMNHGAVVCWAAHQTTWPEWFANHGAFVRCWAHQGKADATSCTEDPATAGGEEDAATDQRLPAVHGKGHGHVKAHGKSKHQG